MKVRRDTGEEMILQEGLLLEDAIGIERDQIYHSYQQEDSGIVSIIIENIIRYIMNPNDSKHEYC